MNFPDTSQEPLNSIDSTISQLRQFEFSRDYKQIVLLLRPFWGNLESEPELEELSKLHKAEFLRSIGYLLVTFGQAQRNTSFKVRGVKYLNRAITIFQQINEFDKSYEARVMVAFAYAQSGNLYDCEKLLNETEKFYRENKSHYNYLLAQVNKLYALYFTGNYEDAKLIIEKNKENIEHFGDDKIKFQFFNQAGIIYRYLKLYPESISSFKSATKYAENLNNLRFLAHAYNNISLVCKDQKNYRSALIFVDKALKISTEFDDYGWVAHFFDTKAEILFEKGDFELALKAINRALFHFRSGSDFTGLAGALWVLIRLLFVTGKSAEAENNFAKLVAFISDKLDESVTAFYYKKYQEFLNQLPLYLRKSEIRSIGFIKSNAEKIESRILNRTLYFFVPRIFAESCFEIPADIVVSTIYSRLRKEDCVLFKYKNILRIGTVNGSSAAGWTIEELGTDKFYSVELINKIWRIVGYNLISEIATPKHNLEKLAGE